MRKYIILFFSVIPFLFACNSSGAPDDVIPPEQMTAVLTEVHLVDGRLATLQQLPDTLYKYGTGRYLAIFKKYHTDSSAFRKSYLYYCSKPDELIDINTKVLAILQTKTDSLNKLIAKQRVKAPKPPASTFHPSAAGGSYGAGVQPQMAPAGKQVPANGVKPAVVPSRRLHPTQPGAKPSVE